MTTSARDSPEVGAGLDVVRQLSAGVLAVSRHLETHEVLRTIVGIARRLLGAEYAALGVPDGAGSFAQFVVDGVSDEQWARIGPLPRQHGLLAAMLDEPWPQRLDDIRTDSRFRWWPEAHPELSAFLGMPIRDGENVLGALFLANKHGGFTGDDEQLLGILAAHAAIALTNARLYERARELTIEQERARLARDLHDAVAQKLFGLRLTAQAAAALVRSEPERAIEELNEVAALAKDAATELRATVVELRPAQLATDGLVATLRKQVAVLDRARRAGGGPRVTFSAADPPELPPTHQEVALRVCQEAMHNALRHAHAATVTVRIAVLPSCGVALEISDDGVGFDQAATRRERGNLGLRSMRARAASVRGRLSITSRPHEGTTVRLEVPCERRDRS